MPVSLTLFQRDDCHLCDEALTVLAKMRVPAFASVFIDDDAALEGRYGLRVPVLRNEIDGMELDWPFDEQRLWEWLQPTRDENQTWGRMSNQ